MPEREPLCAEHTRFINDFLLPSIRYQCAIIADTEAKGDNTP